MKKGHVVKARRVTKRTASSNIVTSTAKVVELKLAMEGALHKASEEYSPGFKAFETDNFDKAVGECVTLGLSTIYIATFINHEQFPLDVDKLDKIPGSKIKTGVELARRRNKSRTEVSYYVHKSQ